MDVSRCFNRRPARACLRNIITTSTATFVGWMCCCRSRLCICHRAESAKAASQAKCDASSARASSSSKQSHINVMANLGVDAQLVADIRVCPLTLELKQAAYIWVREHLINELCAFTHLFLRFKYSSISFRTAPVGTSSVCTCLPGCA